MRKLLVALGMLLIPMAANAGPEVVYSGIDTMRFQNGRYPTSDYAGITDAYIKANDDSMNFGGSPWLRAAGLSATAGAVSTVVAVDVSAFPNNGLVYRARFKVYQRSLVTSANDPQLTLYRLYRPFTEGSGDSTTSTTSVTWVTRMSGSSWVSAGATSRASQSIGGSWQSASAIADTAWYTTNYVGADSLDTGSTTDTPTDPVVTRSTKAGSVGGDQVAKQTGMVTFDVTTLVRQAMNQSMVTNSDQIVRFVIVADEGEFGLTGDLYWRSSEWVDPSYRPALEVEFLDPAATSSTMAGRRVLGPYIVN
jgi:hypothetical protein